jgi:hypothetical protein
MEQRGAVMPAGVTPDPWATVLMAPELNPWGGPGPNFVGRRRAWLHLHPATIPAGPVQIVVQLPNGRELGVTTDAAMDGG